MNKTMTNNMRALISITNARNYGIIQLKNESDHYDGRIVKVQGKDLVHFGNCSYLGLETHDAVKLGGIDALTRYGSLFASSRQYIGLGLNEELEALLDNITGYHTLVTQTTTLGSISAIPVITSSNDLIIVDHQLHASVQNAVKIAQAQGTQVVMLRHSNMTLLEEYIKQYQNKHEKIWYMADGLYSMLGDGCPIEQMYEFMDRYPNFYCFVDDAHGMSWIGENGKGYALSRKPLHQQMVMVMSLAKGFGCCGGVLVFPTPEGRDLVRCIGSSLIFSGPIPTPVLGACIASAKLHLTNEIVTRQNLLYGLIKYFRQQAYAHNLPLMNHTFSPIFYFGAGSENNAHHIVKKMQEAGFFTCICNFPAVPKKNAGIRICLTTHLTFEDIDNALTCMAEIVSSLENEGKLDKDKIYQSFRALEVL
ncbi:MAG: aminotransferase class I/II-fold pyridoxal phosphate-dependent enzyme [Methylococcaceae bacterium]|nr:aminotransferase class I/II-fold pyridoxal phosphate-dependent enzyme [Methylococcaceae bacterium]